MLQTRPLCAFGTSRKRFVMEAKSPATDRSTHATLKPESVTLRPISANRIIRAVSQ